MLKSTHRLRRSLRFVGLMGFCFLLSDSASTSASAQPGHASASLTVLQTVSSGRYERMRRLGYRFGGVHRAKRPTYSAVAHPTLGVTTLAHLNPLGPGLGPKGRYVKYLSNYFLAKPHHWMDPREPYDLQNPIIEHDFFPTAWNPIPIKKELFNGRNWRTIEDVEKLDLSILARYKPVSKKRAKKPKTGKKPDPGFEYSLPDGPKRNPEFEKLGFDALLVKGDELFREGAYSKALDAYRTASRKEPGSAVALWAIAHAQFAAGDFDSAAASMHGALQVRPDIFIHAGIVRMFYGQTDDYDARMGALALRVRKNRNDFRGAFLAGVMLGLDAHCDLAGDHLEGALQLNPDDSLIPELLRSLDAEALDDRPDGHQDQTDPQPAVSVE